jgi:hypothetical protein
MWNQHWAPFVACMYIPTLRNNLRNLCILKTTFRFGVFAFGFYPLGLELSVEVTYPVDEAAGTALISYLVKFKEPF